MSSMDRIARTGIVALLAFLLLAAAPAPKPATRPTTQPSESSATPIVYGPDDARLSRDVTAAQAKLDQALADAVSSLEHSAAYLSAVSDERLYQERLDKAQAAKSSTGIRMAKADLAEARAKIAKLHQADWGNVATVKSAQEALASAQRSLMAYRQTQAAVADVRRRQQERAEAAQAAAAEAAAAKAQAEADARAAAEQQARADDEESEPPSYASDGKAGSYTGGSKTVRVKGYYRKDGTYVKPHSRSAPKSGGGRSRRK